jgi:starch phosphorylase
MTVPEQDEFDLNSLYDVLQNQILPLFMNKEYWRQIVKNGMQDVRVQFDSGRMVTEY